jgi:hypothetical protein
MPKGHSTLAESIKIEAAFRVENELKLIGDGMELITVKSGNGSGKDDRVPDAVQRAALLRRAGTHSRSARPLVSWTPDQQRITPQVRRAALHPGHANEGF